VNISVRARARVHRTTFRGDDVGRFYCEQSAEDEGPSSDGNAKSFVKTRREHASSVERLYIFRRRFDRLSGETTTFPKGNKIARPRGWNQRCNFRSRSVKGEIERVSRRQRCDIRFAFFHSSCVMSVTATMYRHRSRARFSLGISCASCARPCAVINVARARATRSSTDSSDLHLIEIRGVRKVRGDCVSRD